MAEKNSGEDVPPVEESAAPVEQDYLFRLQMAASDFVLGNAKYLGYVVGVLLVSSLMYGVVSTWLSSRRAEEFAAIARVDHKMPKVDEMARYGFAPMDDPTDTVRLENVAEGARLYAALGDTSHGAAAVLAYLRAAEASKRVGKPGDALAALEKASKLNVKELPGFSADAALGGALLDQQRTEEALGHFRAMVGRHSAFYAERSLLLLASAQVAAGKQEDAKLVVKEFQERFPQSPRGAEMASIQARIESGG